MRKRLTAAILTALLIASPARAEPPAPSAYDHYHLGRYAEAEVGYVRQGGYTGQFGAGAAAWRRNDYRAAANHFSAALLLAGNAGQQTDALYNLGNALYGAGDWRAAVDAFLAVTRARPHDANALANLAQSQDRLARQRAAAPMDSDLRGRHGMLAEGEIDPDREAVGREMEATPSRAMVGGGLAPDARIRIADSKTGSGVQLDVASLRSGLKKMELLGDQPQTMLKGLMRQDQSGTPQTGGEPW
jgi:Ca-activated chloride channel family protein